MLKFREEMFLNPRITSEMLSGENVIKLPPFSCAISPEDCNDSSVYAPSLFVFFMNTSVIILLILVFRQLCVEFWDRRSK